jgi:RimJ/RimL family protein N-acetyltransferase
MKRIYKALKNNVFTHGQYSIKPLEYDNRLDIMKWRNEQIYHLRQEKPLTEKDQKNYFNTIVSSLFEKDQPKQLLFGYYRGKNLIGYGGLVHIDWNNKRAEISFIMKTSLEKLEFALHWKIFLQLIEEVAFNELCFNKIYTYAYDLRPHLYPILIDQAFEFESRLRKHYYFDNKYVDCLIHCKFNEVQTLNNLTYKEVTSEDKEQLYIWAIDKQTRRNAINQKEISFEEHLNWFDSKLKLKSKKYFILKNEKTSLGLLRLDKIKGYWNISYLIDKKYRGFGLGQKIIEKAILERDGLPLRAKIKEENIASKRIFQKLSFAVVNNNKLITYEKR